MKNKNGFTLIELLVVIAIIAMLTSIVLASLNTAKIRSKDTAKIRAISEIRTALQMYFSDKGEYPFGDKTNLATVLVGGKYIASIDTSIIVYQAVYGSDDIRACDTITESCQSYRLGVALGDRTNNALTSDINDSVGIFDGQTDTCTSGTSVARNLCFAVKP